MQSSPNYVSVLFIHLLQPISDLFDLLDRSNPQGPNDVQAGMLENGYSVSIIILSALVVESALNRTRYVRNELQRENSVETLTRLGSGNLALDIEEVFVLRDIIAHNHLWTATVRWEGTSTMKLDAPKKLPAYGDPKFKRLVDLKTRATRRLHLDAFPSRIHRATAVAVLKKAVEVLRFLEGPDRNYVYLSQPWRVSRGKKLAHLGCRVPKTDLPSWRILWWYRDGLGSRHRYIRVIRPSEASVSETGSVNESNQAMKATASRRCNLLFGCVNPYAVSMVTLARGDLSCSR